MLFLHPPSCVVKVKVDTMFAALSDASRPSIAPRYSFPPSSCAVEFEAEGKHPFICLLVGIVEETTAGSLQSGCDSSGSVLRTANPCKDRNGRATKPLQTPLAIKPNPKQPQAKAHRLRWVRPGSSTRPRLLGRRLKY